MIDKVLQKLEREWTLWRAQQFENPIEHHGVYLDLKRQEFDDTARYWVINGWFESEEFSLISKHINPSIPVIELGGGYGFISCQLSRHLDANTPQITVEANPSLVQVIEHHRSLNNCEFDIINNAYSPTDEPVRLYLQNKADGSSIRQVRSSEDSIEIDSISLKTLLSQQSFSTFQLVSDIEGAEFQLIESEIEILRNYCVIAIFEMHDYTDESAQETIGKMEDSGFEIIKKEGDSIAFKNTNI